MANLHNGMQQKFLSQKNLCNPRLAPIIRFAMLCKETYLKGNITPRLISDGELDVLPTSGGKDGQTFAFGLHWCGRFDLSKPIPNQFCSNPNQFTLFPS